MERSFQGSIPLQPVYSFDVHTRGCISEALMTGMYGLFSRTVVAPLLAVFGALSLGVPAMAQFETRSTVPTGDAPWSITVDDFNGDGKPDVAIAVANATEISVLLAKGDGTFRASVNYPDPAGPLWIASGDLNHDGKLDLVVANQENSVSVLMSNGDGTFQPAMTFGLLSSPNALVVGDFNGDKVPDLVVADPPYITVLLGNGDGTFQESIDNLSFSTYVPSIAVGDFNRDGKLDVAAAAPNGAFESIAILLGNGDGTLQAATSRSLNYQPQWLAAVDLNGDGIIDLAFGENGGLGVLLGRGDATFGAEADYVGGGDQIVIADFNGDGKLDVAAAGFPITSTVSVLLGNGDGTFKPSTAYPAGAEPAFVAAGDFNGDRKIDLVVIDRLFNNTNILLNTGVVSFSPTTPIRFPPQLVQTVSAPQSINLTNSGAQALAISSVSVQGLYRLSGGTTCEASLAPGASCAISVVFRPQIMGIKNGTVSILDSASSKPQIVELTGAGTVVSLSPAQLRFANQKIGTKSTPQVITVTNQGSGTVAISSVTLNGPDWPDFPITSNCTGALLGPAQECTASVTFSPSKAGLRRAIVLINDNGGGNSQTASLSGMGKK
jgi:hypothetical protein